MKKIYLLLIFFLFLFKHHNAQKFIWAKKFGGAGNDISNAIKVDKGGNFYVAGSFRNDAIFDTITINSDGGEDIFVVKYNTPEKIEWLIKVGGKGSATANAIDIDNEGNIYVAGYFNGALDFVATTLTAIGNNDGFLAKYSFKNLLFHFEPKESQLSSNN